MIKCCWHPLIPAGAAGSPICKLVLNCTDAPGLHINLAEVELYDAGGIKMSTSSLNFAMSSTYNWNYNPNDPRPAALCNDGSYTTLCHSENPSSGDPWPWLSATYPCPDGSTSLSKVVVVNRQDCQSCWFTIDAYSLVFYNAAGEQDVPPMRISSVGSTLPLYSIQVNAAGPTPPSGGLQPPAAQSPPVPPAIAPVPLTPRPTPTAGGVAQPSCNCAVYGLAIAQAVVPVLFSLVVVTLDIFTL